MNEVEGGDVRWRLTWTKATGVADLYDVVGRATVHHQDKYQ